MIGCAARALGVQRAVDDRARLPLKADLDDLAGADGQVSPWRHGDGAVEPSRRWRGCPRLAAGKRAAVERHAVDAVVGQGDAGDDRVRGQVHADGGAVVVRNVSP